MKFNDGLGNESAAELPGQPAIYASFFGLRERPFTLTPNPRFLYLSVRQREALSSLHYALSTPNGFALLTGDAGCGKTTMIRAALADLANSNVKCAVLNNPTLTVREFYEFLSHAFELGGEAETSKVRFLQAWQAHLENRFAEGSLTGLIVDEAQSLSHELLEEIRLLGNIETSSAKLLNVVLAGQPELKARLDEPALRALKQRIALRCDLKPFDLAETAAYIAGRLRIAGGIPQNIFTQEAVIAIYNATRGLPRTVNVLCENALVSGFAEQLKPVPLSIVAEVAKEFEMYEVAVESGADKIRVEEHVADIRDSSATEQVPRLETVVRKKKRFSFFAL